MPGAQGAALLRSSDTKGHMGPASGFVALSLIIRFQRWAPSQADALVYQPLRESPFHFPTPSCVGCSVLLSQHHVAM